jgi:hypothetical protein
MTKKASKKSQKNIFSIFDDIKTPPKNFSSIGYMVQKLHIFKVFDENEAFLIKIDFFFVGR